MHELSWKVKVIRNEKEKEKEKKEPKAVQHSSVSTFKPGHQL